MTNDTNTYYLIDTENIPTKWIENINPQRGDVIFLFRLRDSQKNYITLDDAVKISNTGVKISIIECERGKPKMNALDFQLASCLGYLIGTESCETKNSSFVIYSNDTGFDPVVDYWTNHGFNIKKIELE